jgi:hydrogenase maturation protein HypF
LGDLDDFSSYCSFEEAVRHFEGLFGVAPERMVTDLHPDYPSTLYADRRGGEILRVQHHHAHIAGCMAENRLDEPVIGVALDGTGLGTDGAIWGGEFLSATYEGFRRLAHFRYVRMPGGSAAIREPWRMALAYLEDSGEPLDLLGDRVTRSELNAVGAMLDRGFNSPFTSSAGRLFDAVAALAGLRSRVRHEGQAAMELEWRSAGFPPDSIYPFGLAASIEGGPLTIDTRPLISAVASDLRKGVEPGRVGRRFHSSMVEIIAEVCGRIRSSEGLNSVVLSGGVFMNVLLLEGTVDRLDRDGFAVYRHRLVPPNDGGLCLGQLAISAATSTRPSPSAYVAEAGGCDVPGNPR